MAWWRRSSPADGRARPRQGRRFSRKSLLGFTAFAVVCLLLLGELAIKVGNLHPFASTRTYYADMANVTGLTSGDAVKIAGVSVGQVAAIGVQHGHAVVTLAINRGVKLPEGTEVGIQWRNVIGQMELYLYPPSAGRPMPAGSTIPLSANAASPNLGALLSSFGSFLGAINPEEANAFIVSIANALDGQSAQVRELIANGAVVSKTLGGLNSEIGAVIGDFDQVLSALASRSSDLGSLLDHLDSLTSTLQQHNDLLDQAIGNLGSFANDLASLEKTNHAALSGLLTNLNAVVSTLSTHQSELAGTLSTLGEGIAPYELISSQGQWFQIRTVYTCLANETTCNYYEPTNPPSGTGLLGSPPTSLPLSVPGTSGRAATAQPSGGAPFSGTGGIEQVLEQVAGATSDAGSGAGAGKS